MYNVTKCQTLSFGKKDGSDLGRTSSTVSLRGHQISSSEKEGFYESQPFFVQ